MDQEVSARKMLETENEALKIALSQAQAGSNVPVTQTSEHIHAVSLGLLSPWEGMVQAQAQVQGLEYELKGACAPGKVISCDEPKSMKGVSACSLSRLSLSLGIVGSH